MMFDHLGINEKVPQLNAWILRGSLGDPEDASSGTLDGVMWMSAFVVKVHEDHFATWRADG